MLRAYARSDLDSVMGQEDDAPVERADAQTRKCALVARRLLDFDQASARFSYCTPGPT